MRWLRSRWTVVALVPTFFLAGFAIVSAVAGGSNDSEPRSAQGQAGTSTDRGAVTITGSTTGEASEAVPTTATGTSSQTTTDADGGNGGNRRSGPPPAPPPGTIAIDYGPWDGMFEVSGAEIVPDFGLASVTGELRYFGGVDCPIGMIIVHGWFYGPRGDFIGKALWESPYATGEGGEVTGREGLPFEAYGVVSEAPESARLRFTRVDCL